MVVLFVNARLQLKKLHRFLKRNVQQNLETLIVLNFVFVYIFIISARVSRRPLKTKTKFLQPIFGLPLFILMYLLKTLKVRSAFFYFYIKEKYNL